MFVKSICVHYNVLNVIFPFVPYKIKAIFKFLMTKFSRAILIKYNMFLKEH